MDKFQGEGGSFEIRNGERVQVSAPGKPHPEGDRARDADGKPVDLPPPNPQESALPAPPADTVSASDAAPAVAADAAPRRAKRGE